MFYIVFFLISIALLYRGDKFRKPFNYVYMVLGLAPAILIAGLRDDTIGTDTSMYPTDVFEFCRDTKSIFLAVVSYIDVEPGYVVLAYLSSTISSSFNFFLTLTHTLILGTLLIAYKRFGVNIAFAFLCFYLIFFASSLNMARQFLAMPICLWGLAEFTEKKYKRTFIILLLAFLFHKTSFLYVIIIALYFLCRKYTNKMAEKKSFIYISFVVIIGIVFFSQILELLMNIGIADDRYMERYGSDEMYGSHIPISSFAINAFNLVMYYKLSTNITNSPFIIFSKYVMLIGLLLCFMGLISVFAVRLNLYFLMTAIVCITYLLQKLNFRKSRFFIIFYLFYWVMVVIVANLSDTYPYQSKILFF